MGQVIVRNVPEDIHLEMRLQALREGKTINALAIEAMRDRLAKGAAGQRRVVAKR